MPCDAMYATHTTPLLCVYGLSGFLHFNPFFCAVLFLFLSLSYKDLLRLMHRMHFNELKDKCGLNAAHFSACISIGIIICFISILLIGFLFLRCFDEKEIIREFTVSLSTQWWWEKAAVAVEKRDREWAKTKGNIYQLSIQHTDNLPSTNGIFNWCNARGCAYCMWQTHPSICQSFRFNETVHGIAKEGRDTRERGRDRENESERELTGEREHKYERRRLMPLFEWTRPFHCCAPNRLKHPMMTSSNRFAFI